MAVRSAEDISKTIKNDFLGLTGKVYRDGSAIDYFTEAVSRSMEDAYTEIEKAKNPHIYTNLSGDNLDKMGVFVDVTRQKDEGDEDYLYRIMNWTYLKAGANLTAVNDSLLNLEYASNAQYYPGIHGAGTGVVYVIPTKYDDDTIAKALKEAKDRIKNVISPESYTEYIIPTPLPVDFVCHLETEIGDTDYLKSPPRRTSTCRSARSTAWRWRTTTSTSSPWTASTSMERSARTRRSCRSWRRSSCIRKRLGGIKQCSNQKQALTS